MITFRPFYVVENQDISELLRHCSEMINEEGCRVDEERNQVAQLEEHLHRCRLQVLSNIKKGDMSFKKIVHLRSMHFRLLRSLPGMKERVIRGLLTKHDVIKEEFKRIQYRMDHLGALLRKHAHCHRRAQDEVDWFIQLRKAVLQAIGLELINEE